jgi:hypothetical protein
VADLVIDTNQLLLLIGCRCLKAQDASPALRERVLAEIRGRPDRVTGQTFDDLWKSEAAQISQGTDLAKRFVDSRRARDFDPSWSESVPPTQA